MNKNPVIREPHDNVYGRFKVLARADGRYVVFDPRRWPPDGPVFDTEHLARTEAGKMFDADSDGYEEREEEYQAIE